MFCKHAMWASVLWLQLRGLGMLSRPCSQALSHTVKQLLFERHPPSVCQRASIMTHAHACHVMLRIA